MKWRKGLPEKSGMYIVVMSSDLVTKLMYSSEHQLFNAYDEQSEEDAEEWAIKDIKLWIPAKEVLEDALQGSSKED